VARAASALEDDFQPLDDLRATADYRLKTAANLVERFRLELLGGVPTRIAEVA
jgi:xanthine dehydrogenase small subunit